MPITPPETIYAAQKAHADRWCANAVTNSACAYCGDPAGSWDHVIPHSFDHSQDTPRQWRNGVVPACRHCNAMLGANIFDSLDERLAYVAWRLRAKSKKLLATPEWTMGELKQLGYNLRKGVILVQSKRRAILRRLRFLERGSFDAFNEAYSPTGAIA